MSITPWLRQSLDVIHRQNRYRSASALEEGLINFSSNDYLGLSRHPELIAAAEEATTRFGTGAGASRLVGGTLALPTALETDIAEWKQTEAALLFNSGYHANIGIIPALAGDGDVILSDALNHASLIDGCRLSKARTAVFAHNDMAALETTLVATTAARHRLIVTESVFSMDGDRAPLAEILDLALRYDAWVYLDEAHATGVLGRTGAGLVEELGVPPARRERLIQMGTLGKALGSFGAYVAGTALLKDYLINCARSFIFTTALPPAPVAAARQAIALIRRDERLRTQLWENLAYFHQQARPHTPSPFEGDRRKSLWEEGQGEGVPSAIIPWILGSEANALAASQRLRENGLFVQAIRPPTIPAGSSRLRITISAAHTKRDIEQLVRLLKEISPTTHLS